MPNDTSSTRTSSGIVPEEEHNSEQTFVNFCMLQNLKCTNCSQYMLHPIHQCVQGHAICENCKRAYRTCDICKCPLSPTRNLPLENIATRVKFPCCYHTRGCKGLYSVDEINKHESRCRRSDVHCAIDPTCQWTGRWSQLSRHVIENHPGERKLGSENKAVYKMSPESRVAMARLMEAYGELFWCYYIQDERTVYFSVFWIGAEDGTETKDKPKFYFDLTLASRNYNSRVINHMNTLCRKENQSAFKLNFEEQIRIRKEKSIQISTSMLPLGSGDDSLRVFLKVRKEDLKSVNILMPVSSMEKVSSRSKLFITFVVITIFWIPLLLYIALFNYRTRNGVL